MRSMKVERNIAEKKSMRMLLWGYIYESPQISPFDAAIPVDISRNKVPKGDLHTVV